MVEVLFIRISDKPSDAIFYGLKELAENYDKWLLTEKTLEQVKEHSFHFGMQEKKIGDISIFYEEGLLLNNYTIVREAS